MIYRTLTALALALALAIPAAASADEITGTLTTGVSTGISGIVDAAPMANPPAGTYTSAQTVTLTAAGADIRYTVGTATGGVTEPNCSSIGTLYAGPLTVSSSETIRAIACFSGGHASAVGTFAYGINLPPAPSGASGSSGGGGGGGGGGGSSGGGGGTLPTTTTAPVIGDTNGDGKIDILDFTTLVSEWGQTGANLSADLNHDGVVDILDFTMLLANWTQ